VATSPPFSQNIRIVNPGSGSAFTNGNRAQVLVRDGLAAAIPDGDGVVRRISLHSERAAVFGGERQMASRTNLRRIPFIGNVDLLLVNRSRRKLVYA